MGYIGIDRGIEEHWIYQDAEYFKVWFEILLRARFSRESEKKVQDGVTFNIEYGQFMYGRIKWSERLKVSERRLRTLFDRLVRDDMIRLVAKYPKFTIYSVTNYEKYNSSSPETRQDLAGNSPETDQQSDQQQTHTGQAFWDIVDQQNDSTTTSSRPAADQQATTQEESKKKDKKGINKDIIYTPEFDSFWENYPKQIGKPAAFKNWKKLIKKVTPEYLIECAMNYTSYCIAKKTETTYIKQPNNFLNEKEEYYKQFETPVVIHSNPYIPKQSGKMSSFAKLQQLAEEEYRREASGNY